MKNKTRIGIVGCGFMGKVHNDALRRIPQVEIKAVVDESADVAKQFADTYNIPLTYKIYTDMLDSGEVDAIHNCTPNFLHYEVNKKALEKGIYVVSEKPLALDHKQAKELADLAAKKHIPTAVGFAYRFFPLIQTIKEMIKNGDLGEIRLVKGEYLQDWLFYKEDYNWRLEKKISGESRAFADIGSHLCDTIEFVTDKKIKALTADISTIHKTRLKPKEEALTFAKSQGESEHVAVDTEDYASVLGHLEDNIKGVFTVSQVSAGKKNGLRIEIYGSKASVIWEQEKPNQMWIGHRNKANEILLKDPSLMPEGVRSYAALPGGHNEGYNDAFKALFTDYYKCVNGEPLKNIPDFASGCRQLLVTEAVLKSNRTKSWIKL